MRRGVSLLALLIHLVRACAAVQLVAPPRCGGSRVVPHAGAQFGLRLVARSTSIPVYATSARGTRLLDWIRSDTWGLGVLCAPLEGSIASEASGRIIFASRGECDFQSKAAHAQAAGAVGLVVVNYRSAAGLVAMKLNESATPPNPAITIPAVMVRYADWKLLAPCRGELELALNTVGEAGRRDPGREALNWAVVRGLALWILCQCGVNVVRYKRRVAQCRVRANAVANLPNHIFGSMEEDRRKEDAPICAVCLETVQPGDRVRRLPCGNSHLFHQECIDPWLERSSSSCPVCKRNIAGLPPPPNTMSNNVSV